MPAKRSLDIRVSTGKEAASVLPPAVGASNSASSSPSTGSSAEKVNDRALKAWLKAS